MLVVLPLLAFFAAVTSAIRVIEPKNSTIWKSDGPRIIRWDSVSTDPWNFTLRLIAPDDSIEGVVIADSLDTKGWSYTYVPPRKLAPGTYRLNFVSRQIEENGILAQSDMFEVEEGVSGVDTQGHNLTASLTATSSATHGAHIGVGTASVTPTTASQVTSTPTAPPQTANQGVIDPAPTAGPSSVASAASGETSTTVTSSAVALAASPALLAVALALLGSFV